MPFSGPEGLAVARSNCLTLPFGAFRRRFQIRSNLTSAPLKNIPEAGGKIDVGEFGRVREHRPYLGFAVTSYAAAYWGYQELVLGMLTGEGYEAVNGEFEAVQAFHRGNGVGSALKALAHSPLCAEVIQSKTGGSAGMHSLGVAAKDEYLTRL